jgi:hypothetical protein
MRRRGEPPPAPQPPPAAVEFAWKVHAAQEAWTAKVDGKAAIVLSLETAVLAALFAVESPRLLLGRLVGWHSVLADTGVGLHVIAVALAAAAVIPLLGRTREHKVEHANNAIYFGHLRHWRHDQLSDRLRHLSPDDELQQLGRQLVALSRRNWRKHRNLQLSMLAALVGSALIGTAVLIPR